MAALDADAADAVWLRARTERRRVARSRLPDGTPCLVKHFLTPRRHRVRERCKRALRIDGARREWHALERLRAAGLRVPEPLALLRLANGEDALVTEWIEARSLSEALAAPAAERRATVRALGGLVRALHAAGWTHGDLNRGNVLVAADGPVLVDLQSALPLRRPAARRNDLGTLDHSLRPLLAVGDRIRLRAAGLGLAPPFDATARAALRAVGCASRAVGRSSAASRAARSLRPGRRARALRAAGGAGLIARGADEKQVVTALLQGAAPPGLELRRFEGRWSDLWRGSAARRAWQRAHALESARLPRPAPLAFVEWPRLGRPGHSAIVLEASRERVQSTLAQRAEAAARLWARLHEAGFRPPAPGAAHLRFARRGAVLEAAPAALERVGPPARLSARQRRRDLDALDAAWRRLGADEAARRRALESYRRSYGCGGAGV